MFNDVSLSGDCKEEPSKSSRYGWCAKTTKEKHMNVIVQRTVCIGTLEGNKGEISRCVDGLALSLRRLVGIRDRQCCPDTLPLGGSRQKEFDDSAKGFLSLFPTVPLIE